MKAIPDLVQQLLQQLQQVPYLASKNVYKVANYFLEQDADQAVHFCKVLLDAVQKTVRCQRCFVWSEIQRPCVFCDDASRETSLICVVEKWPDVLVLERMHNYRGLYHVLGGFLSPLHGVGPANLTIDALVQRLANTQPKELILALSQTPEGEATTAYILGQIPKSDLKVSVLAQGVPVGASLEYMDRVTLMKAMINRKQLV